MTSHHRSYGTLTTVPPSRAIASSFVCGAFSGAMIVAGTPSSRAAQATPWAMLPALAVTTPLAVAAGGACRIALTAPRILNEPIGCRFSSLSQISAGPSTGRRRSGVRIAAPAIVSRARSISAKGIRTRPRCRALLAGLPDDQLGGGEVLDGEPERLEDGQLVAARAAGMGADQHLAELGADVLLAEPGEQQVARLVHGRLTPVDEEAGRGHRLRVELADGRDARADGVHVRARRQPVPLQDRLAGARAGADDVGLAQHLLGRAAVAAAPRADLGVGHDGAHRLRVRTGLDAGAEDRDDPRVRGARAPASRPPRRQPCGSR